MKKPAFSSNVVATAALLCLPLSLVGQDREPAQSSVAAVSHEERALSDGGCQSCADVFDRASNGTAWRTPYETCFIFGGAYSTGSMGDTLYSTEYDGNSMLAVGYQRFTRTIAYGYLGWEIGLANRFGEEDNTVEVWAGGVIRGNGWSLGRFGKITPSFTAGFSLVSDVMDTERRREKKRFEKENEKGDATFLIYLGPELAFSTPALPNFELFYRLHHRSGAGGTFGNLTEGYNANTLGIRYKY